MCAGASRATATSTTTTAAWLSSTRAARRSAWSRTSRSSTARRRPTGSTTSASTSIRGIAGAATARTRRRCCALPLRHVHDRARRGLDRLETSPSSARSERAGFTREGVLRRAQWWGRRLARRRALQQAARRVGLPLTTLAGAQLGAGPVDRTVSATPARSILSGGTCTRPLRETFTESSSVSVAPGLSAKLVTPSSGGVATSIGGVTWGGTALSVTQLSQPR